MPKVNVDTGELLPPVVRRTWMRSACRTVNDKPSRTHQSHKDACDVNKIVANYIRTEYLPPGKGPGAYADVSGLQGDLTERITMSRETIAKAEETGRKIAAARKDKAKADAAAKRKADADADAASAVTPPSTDGSKPTA